MVYSFLRSAATPSSRNPRLLLSLVLFVLFSDNLHFVNAMSLLPKGNKVIDSHLHVWANKKESATQFPYSEGGEPPESLQDVASTSSLLEQMDQNGVDGSLIVQPINHKFDHSYVLNAIKTHPNRFKGMLLFDPSLPTEDAITTLEDLTLKGFVGVRFNPYLWPSTGEKQWVPMSKPNSSGLAVYKRCGELNMPVGVMCFQGLQYHYDDIVELLKASPDTTLILDHFGFTALSPEGDEAFEKLLSLSTYPQVIIKVSALFRLNDDTSGFERVRTERFIPLLEKFGSNRLMFGTDFPFVLEQEPEKYDGTIQLVSSKSWIENEQDRIAIMGGTAERIFGPWGRK